MDNVIHSNMQRNHDIKPTNIEILEMPTEHEENFDSRMLEFDSRMLNA